MTEIENQLAGVAIAEPLKFDTSDSDRMESYLLGAAMVSSIHFPEHKISDRLKRSLPHGRNSLATSEESHLTHTFSCANVPDQASPLSIGSLSMDNLCFQLFSGVLSWPKISVPKLNVKPHPGPLPQKVFVTPQVTAKCVVLSAALPPTTRRIRENVAIRVVE